jgi:hypothetical protein
MTPSLFEAEQKWRVAAINAVVRVNLGARRRLQALKLNNSKHTRPIGLHTRPIGFTLMMNPLTKKIQRTYVLTDQCLFCVVYCIWLKRFKTVSSCKQHKGCWHLSNIYGTRLSCCPDIGYGEAIYGPIYWDNHVRNYHIDLNIWYADCTSFDLHLNCISAKKPNFVN